VARRVLLYGAMRDRTARAGVRGFTLTEMMIVVAMIGVLAALSLVGYRRYINAAQAAEAKSMIQMIRGGQETYKSEMLQYLNVSSGINAYYPNPNPTDLRYAWVFPGGDGYANWMLLNLNPDGPVRFGYACVSGFGSPITPPSDFAGPVTLPSPPATVPWYSIQARNQRDPGRAPELYAGVSGDSTILSENGEE
jgi:type IV pilus assembly protein PilA